MTMKVCNLCGGEFDVFDEQEGFSIHKTCGYGTKFDGERLELDICCGCMEKLVDSCVVTPITGAAYGAGCDDPAPRSAPATRSMKGGGVRRRIYVIRKTEDA